MLQTSLETCRVIIAEDHAVLNSGLKFLLAQSDGFELVGEAGDGDEALQCLRQTPADILILDLALPRKTGLVILETIKQWSKRPRVLVLSGQATALDFKHAAELGAEALVSKEDAIEDLLTGLRTVRDGDSFISPIVRRMLQPFEQVDSKDEMTQLTPREREVLALVAEGRTNAWIARELGIAEKTAKRHRENIRGKLKISSAVEATRIAARLGLTKI